MRNLAMRILTSVVLLVASSLLLAQNNPPVTKPGLEVPLITPGPGWDACPRCKNDAYAAAAREKAQVDTHAFDPHNLSGVWSGDPADLNTNGTPLNVKTIPPFTPYGQKLYDATLSDYA